MLSLGKALGISPDVWENKEELKDISHYDLNFDREKAKDLNIDLITLLKEEYGDALTCVFRLGDLPVLDINQVTDDNDLAEFYRSTEGSPTLIFDFKLDKTQLISNKIGNAVECHFFLYFFSKALLNFLGSGLSELERSLWGSEPSSKVVLFVLDHEIWLNGEYIAVLGGERIGYWRDIITKSSQEGIEQIRNMYDVCQKNLHWQAQWLEYLTPMHLKMNGQVPYDDPISKALLIHQVNLIILYTAYRTKGDTNNPILSTYDSTSQSVELTLKNPSKNHIDNKVIANAGNLMEMLEWVYELKLSSDRLSFIQIAVTQHLHAASPPTRYQLFLYDAKSIFDQLKWNWQAFIDGKVDNYVSQVQSLEDYVANTVQQFAEQTTSMIKSLSDTMLAAVGVSIGSFIVALFQDKFNQNIFTFGVSVYALYVFIFPLCFNMRHQWEQYNILCNNFKERQRRFNERLYPDKVSEIVGVQIKVSQKKFKSWFIIICATYISVILLAIVATIYAPEFIQSSMLSIQNNTSSVDVNYLVLAKADIFLLSRWILNEGYPFLLKFSASL